MRQTLFLIPQSWLEGPILIGWLIVGLLILAWLVYRHGWKAESLNFLPMYGVIAALLYFIAPKIGITDINPANPGGPEVKVGLAIRGYGLMMVAGIFAGVGLSMYRGRREGIDPEKITVLGFWMCICGVIGARLFYIIQKRDQFGGSPLEMLGDMVNMTQGGLVVYGSLIGATVGGAIYMKYSKIPMLKMADIAAPGMLVGLALGRIGCLLNGCCYGGVCDIPQIAQEFPAGSPPYVRQLETGELLGIDATDGTGMENLPPRPDELSWYANSVEEGSLADLAGIEAGSWFRTDQFGFPSGHPLDKELRFIKSRDNQSNYKSEVAVRQQDRVVAIGLQDLPDYSVGVYPTQLIATINAALLALLLWIYFPFRRRNGQVFALLIILYSITRFLIELIRRDEYGQFGTGLTISQWVSVLAILGGFALFALTPERTDKPGIT